MAMKVTLQYLDGCPNWETARADLEILRSEDPHIDIELQRINTVERAEEVGFRGSPTILIDGVDPFANAGIPIGLVCRLYRTPEGFPGSPGVDDLRSAIGTRR